MLLKELKEHQFCDKLLEIIAYAKKNNAMNMGQLYCGKMKKVHCNLQCGNNQLMCSKFKTCVMPHNEGLRARM